MPNPTAGDEVADGSILMVSNLIGILVAGNCMRGIISSSSCLTLVFNSLSSLTNTLSVFFVAVAATVVSVAGREKPLVLAAGSTDVVYYSVISKDFITCLQ